MAGGGGGAHPLGHELQVGDHPGHRGEAERQQVVRVEQRRLVVLQILGIGQRQALQQHQQRDQVADDPRRMAADQLGGVGVALVGHDRRSGRPGVGQLDEAERLRRPQDDLLGQPRQMDRAERGGVEIIDDEIAVADRIEAVGGRPVEAERLGGRVAVDREAGPGQRRAAQRAIRSSALRASAKRLRSRTSISR